MNEYNKGTIDILENLYDDFREKLEELKKDGLSNREHKEWPWIGLVYSFATLGRASHLGRKVVPVYNEKLSWNVVNSLSNEERKNNFFIVPPRFKPTRSEFLELAYQKLKNIGDIEDIRNKVNNIKSGDEILEFWESFKGLGPKYARNIMMDVYDPRFRNGFFAVDVRIDNLLPKLGYEGPNKYLSKERFLAGIAKELNIECWELDRMLFSNYEYLNKVLK